MTTGSSNEWRSPRWYRGYSARGNSRRLIEDVSAFVRRQKLTDTICGMRVEKGARGQFYFFLTVESDIYGELPADIEDVLERCPPLNPSWIVQGTYALPDIQTLVSGELEVKALGHCLAYRHVRTERVEDPLDADTEDTPAAVSEGHEHFLWWASATGSGSWSTFRNACQTLGLAQHPAEPRRLLRRLRLLGHLETSPDGQRWSVTPPALLEAPTLEGGTLRFLSGARTPGPDSGERTGIPGAPARQLASAAPAGTEEVGHAALRLAEVLPDLDTWCVGLARVESVNPAVHRVLRHDGARFREGKFAGQTGLYQLAPHKTLGGMQFTLFYDADCGEWLRGDWYGLRFLSLARSGALSAVQYDASAWRLAVPVDERWPELYERPLVLSSGVLPTWQQGWLVYENVPPTVAQLLTERLGLRTEAR